MLVTEFDYDLPRELVAQEPPAERGTSRMMALDRQTGSWRDTFFTELPDLLAPGDLMVLNESRVIPARLLGQTDRCRIEILLTQQTGEWEWQALGKPGRRLPVGQTILFRSQEGWELSAEIVGAGAFGERSLRFEPIQNFFARLDQIGHTPLPPYIRRPEHAIDRERYQTVYARERGSAAAPTAGLHFTRPILDRIRRHGIEIASITLHVGLGTFQPVRVENVEAIHLHSERYSISEETAAAIRRAQLESRRIIAVGTTTVRALEHAAQASPSGEIEAQTGATSLFISPGFQFKVVQAMLTNFHLPQSTLLMLVSAFAGRERVLAAYHHAVEARYRFFSYGDCMLIA